MAFGSWFCWLWSFSYLCLVLYRCCWYYSKRCSVFICPMTPRSVLEELQKNHINSPLAFLSITAVTGGLKMHCHRERAYFEMREMLLPFRSVLWDLSYLLRYPNCINNKAMQPALGLSSEEESFIWLQWSVCTSDFSSSSKSKDSFF